MPAYDQLLSADPAWPELAARAATVAHRVTVLPRQEASARACLEGLQVTTRSPLGAIAHETGGVLIDHGWMRLLGSGHPRLSRTLGGWDADLGIALADFMIVADDVTGGAFAINGGALGPARGTVHYFAPDTLRWEDLKLGGYGAFVSWAFAGDLATFYANLRWPGWEAEAEQVGGDRALSLYPPPWTAEGKDVSRVSRRAVPVAEV
ncbi:MAG TPA: DUF2625 family protein [Kofleriaceae bacterium]|jgi:hypothetical protein